MYIYTHTLSRMMQTEGYRACMWTELGRAV